MNGLEPTLVLDQFDPHQIHDPKSYRKMNVCFKYYAKSNLLQQAEQIYAKLYLRFTGGRCPRNIRR